MTKLEEKIKQLETLLKLSDISIHINQLKKAGWSDEEIGIIIDRFMSGDVLSEIIAPAKNATEDSSIHMSINALQDFDRFFCGRKHQIPGLVDKLSEIWQKKEIKKMNKEKKQKEFNKIKLQTKIPDFIGAWVNREGVETFGREPIYKSYVLGFVTSQESSIVVDLIGISTIDNPFTTKGVLVQNYDEDKCQISMKAEMVRYWPDKNVKKSGFDKNFSIIDQWDGNYTTGEFDIVGEDPCGVFILIKDDKGPLFQRLAKEISQKLALSLKLL